MKLRLSLLLTCLVVSACGTPPKGVVSNYYDAQRAGDFDKAWGYLSSADQAFTPLGRYKADVAKRAASAGGSFASLSYEVKSETVQGDRATVVVALTLPEVDVATKDGEPEGDTSQAGNQSAVRMVTRDKTVNLVKEETGWRIFENFEVQAKMTAALEAIPGLEQEDKLDEAKAKAEQVLALDPGHEGAGKKLEELKTRIAQRDEMLAYFASVQIRRVRVDRTRNTSLGAVNLVEGELRNQGDRTLDRADIVVVCLDKDGASVHETADMVFDAANPYLKGAAGRPLKPNSTRSFLTSIKDPPSGWTGRVQVRLTSLKFQESN